MDGRVRVVFDLPQDPDGWPPATSERLWAVRLNDQCVRLDNVPFFVRGYALGDVVLTAADDDGVLWAKEALKFSDNCTIRVLPLGDGDWDQACQAVLDVFAPHGVTGEGIAQFGLVALNVPDGTDLAEVRRLLDDGADNGHWDYEEGCVTPAWTALA